MTIKALSIRQPWAWAILFADPPKDIENRDWHHAPAYRGPLLIHASTTAAPPAALDFIERVIGRKLTGHDMAMMHTGGIVGVAYMHGVVRQSASPWFMGKIGFQLRSPRPLTKTPMRGVLGLFDVEPAKDLIPSAQKQLAQWMEENP